MVGWEEDLTSLKMSISPSLLSPGVSSLSGMRAAVSLTV